MTFELLNVLVLFGIVLVAVLAYAIRVTLKGPAHSDRVDQAGSSPLLGKSLMELGYWSFQPLARLLIACHVSANQVSWLSFILGFFAGLCLAYGHFGSGAVFATLSFIFDSLDGMVARETGRSSEAGEVLDASIDRYVEFFFFSGLTIYYREVPVLMVLCLFALLGAFMVSYSTVKAEALQVEPPKGNMRRPERAFYLTLGAALSPVTIPWLEASRDYPIAIAHPMVIALCLVAVLANVSAAERFWLISRAIRRREAGLPPINLNSDLSEISEPSMREEKSQLQ